jgi:hypothetical protein
MIGMLTTQEGKAMDWNALIGALIGAGIPAILVYAGLHRQRQSADAEAFGPAVLLLDRVNPDRLVINLIRDPVAEAAMLADLQQQINVARERLLVVSAGSPRRQVRQLARIAEVQLANVFHGSSWAARDLQVNRNNPEWMDHARRAHAEAVDAMDALVAANFAWSVFGHRPRADARRSGRQGWPAPPVAATAPRGGLEGRLRRRGRMAEPGTGVRTSLLPAGAAGIGLVRARSIRVARRFAGGNRRAELIDARSPEGLAGDPAAPRRHARPRR